MRKPHATKGLPTHGCEYAPKTTKAGKISKIKPCPSGFKLRNGCCEKTLADVIKRGVMPLKIQSREKSVLTKLAQQNQTAVLEEAKQHKISPKKAKELERIVPLIIPILVQENPKIIEDVVKAAEQQDSKVAVQKGWLHSAYQVVANVVKGAKQIFVKVGGVLVSAVKWLLTRPEFYFAVSVALLYMRAEICRLVKEETIPIYVAKNEPSFFRVLWHSAQSVLEKVVIGAATYVLSPVIQAIAMPIVSTLVKFLLQFMWSALIGLLTDFSNTSGQLALAGIVVVVLIALFQGCPPSYHKVYVPVGTKDALTEEQWEKLDIALQTQIGTAVKDGYTTKQLINDLKKSILAPKTAHEKIQRAAQHEWTAYHQQPIQGEIPKQFQKPSVWQNIANRYSETLRNTIPKTKNPSRPKPKPSPPKTRAKMTEEQMFY